MLIKINTSIVSFLILCLLLPILHLQNYLSASGLTWTISGIGFLPFPAVFFLWIIFFKQKHSYLMYIKLMCFFQIFFLSLIIILLNYNVCDGMYNSASLFNIKILYYYFIYFTIGLFFERFNNKGMFVILFWIFMVTNLIYHYDSHFFTISLDVVSEESKGIYLFMGDSFALWSILVLSFLQKRPFITSCVYLLSIVFLFLFVSRTSLYVFVLLFPIIIYLTKNSFKYFLLIFLILSLIVYSYEFIDTLMAMNSRMFAFQQINEDSSVISRSFLYKEGVSAIKNNWFLGDYAGQIKYGGIGSYIHNYLSLWRQFGLIPFIYFCVLMVFCLNKFYYILKKFQINVELLSEEYFFIVGGVFCIIEIIAARSYVTPYIWLFIGIALNPRLKSDEILYG